MWGGVQGLTKIGECLVVLAAGGIAVVISSWGPRPAETADRTSDSVQVRAEEDAFSQNPKPILSNLSTAYPAFQLSSDAMFGYVHTDVPELSRALEGRTSPRVENSQRQGAAPRSMRVPRDASSFFNEAQLASIKTRLNLTPAQQPYWPPLESALRAIQWRRSEDKAARNTQTKSLDLDGEQVQRLTAAATPLVMKLRADQKEEVKTLLHLMGMEQLASRF